jgi:hypothetical protein
MKQKRLPDLEMVLGLGTTGQIYPEHFEQWRYFKEQWSVEDRIRWKSLLSRIHKKPDGSIALRPPLSEAEKKWANDLVHRAEALDLC